jgi:pimeloyl-ACP methyl ester carboxylesterase
MPVVAARSAIKRPTKSAISVDTIVQLEVKDWGGAGPPLVLLAGFGRTASDFDGFAQKFTERHRVLAITRRGFGGSSAPTPVAANYTPERLAADTIAVLDKLKIKTAFIAGHSVAGQELSELGSRYPDRIAGLIYMEAANAQAFYGANADRLYPIAGEIRRDLEKLIKSQPSEATALVAKIKNELPRLQRGLAWYGRAVQGVPDRPAEMLNSPITATQNAIVLGAKVYGPLGMPILALFAAPPQCAPDCASGASKRRASDTETQIKDFKAANPKATVISLSNASHFIWESNEADTVKAMDAFMDAGQRGGANGG